jgi:hypothetical protein
MTLGPHYVVCYPAASGDAAYLAIVDAGRQLFRKDATLAQASTFGPSQARTLALLHAKPSGPEYATGRVARLANAWANPRTVLSVFPPPSPACDLVHRPPDSRPEALRGPGDV